MYATVNADDLPLVFLNPQQLAFAIAAPRGWPNLIGCPGIWNYALYATVSGVIIHNYFQPVDNPLILWASIIPA
jgi:hypothetical protein